MSPADRSIDAPSDEEREGSPAEDDRFEVDPGERTRWTEDAAKESGLDPKSEPGRGAPYEPQESPVTTEPVESGALEPDRSKE